MLQFPFPPTFEFSNSYSALKRLSKQLHLDSRRFSMLQVLFKSIFMAKDKQNLNLKIQMLAGKGTKDLFEILYKNLTSLVRTRPAGQDIHFVFIEIGIVLQFTKFFRTFEFPALYHLFVYVPLSTTEPPTRMDCCCRPLKRKVNKLLFFLLQKTKVHSFL